MAALLLYSGGYSYSSEIFIHSDPIGAEVYLGDERIGKTPLRLRNVEEGTFILSIEKDGFQRVRDEVTLRENERTKLLFYDLFPLSIDFILHHENRDVYINGVLAGKSPLIIKNIPPGTYDMSSDNGAISISGAEYRRMKKATVFETVFATGLFAASIAGSLTSDRNDTSPQAYALRISPFIAGGILGYDLLKLCKLRTGLRRDRKMMKGIEVVPWRGEMDRDLLTEGVELIGEESWREAIGKFNLLVNLYPDSQYVPLSLYEMGYSYYRMEEYGKAKDYFRRFIHEYPVYEFYSYGAYYLIDAERTMGNYSAALGEYESLRPLYLDDVMGEIYGLYYNLFVDLYEKTGSANPQPLGDLIDELDYFMEQYGDSLLYPDILFLKGKLLYKYLDRDGGIDIFNEIGESFSYRKEIMLEMEAILHGK